MTILPAMLGVMMAILQAHPLCKRTEILETGEFSTDQFHFKVRSELPREFRLQVRVYFNHGHVDYAFQLFNRGIPVLRWDNKEEFRTLKTFPHHFHDNHGNVLASPLTGNPRDDVVLVLGEIEKFLAIR